MRIIEEKLKGLDCIIKVEKHRIVGETEYLRLTASCGEGVTIHIREFVKAGKVMRYSYQLIIKKQESLRYDNAPHHPGIRTYPHHKHEKGRVLPLENPTLTAFLEETLKILTT